MQRRSAIIFVVLNIFLSLGIAYGVITLVGGRSQPVPETSQVITVQFVITATPGPTQTPFIITATPPEGVVLLPTGLFGTPTNITGALTGAGTPTIDPAVLAGGSTGGETLNGTTLPPNCILHTLEEGDTPFSIAEEYGADGAELMAVNGLDDDTARFLQIGQVLIVPLEGCGLTAAALQALQATEEVALATDTPEAPTAVGSPATETAQPSPTATRTLPPTAANAQMEILRVISPGIITAEAVEIRNNGNTVNISGWRLVDGQGNEYVFSEQLLFSQGRITVYTGSGTDSPPAKYWGQQTAVYESGDSVTLLDANGRVQSTFVIP